MTGIDKPTIRRGSHVAQANLNILLEEFGDYLGEAKDYELSGIEALHLYLVREYKWPLKDVRAMNLDDIGFVLRVEMKDWTAPKHTKLIKMQDYSEI